MQPMRTDRFVRLPTALLEELLRLPLSGTEWSILLWVVRNTHGWNRTYAAFSWYRVAKDLALDRAGAYRRGQKLSRAGVLAIEGSRISIEEDPDRWNLPRRPGRAMAQTMTPGNVDARHRMDGQPSAVCRAAKDRTKERTYRYARNAKTTAGAAQPVPGKYDRFAAT